ncbi:MAG: hypothetical protein M1813_007588 [Trichoglossum hirsutum]|nr:MAG: hypothetical protein M1813_007588 [Trichoglossum hirsutum]
MARTLNDTFLSSLTPSWLPPRKSNEANSDSLSTTTASSSSSKPFGLKVLHVTDSAVVDIVFIHGLKGHREKTWTAENADAPWPQTLLPRKLPQSRIFTFGYDTDVYDWRTMVSKNRIGNHAKNLLATLAAYREIDDTNDRPVIFVAHNLGGLVCEDALLASRNSAEDHLQNILKYARGIIFLGTPHSGSGLAQWAQLLAKSIGLIEQANPQILETLQADSEVLARIQTDFHNMIRVRANNKDQHIDITCFYEELPLPGIGEVVPMHSAILPAYVSMGIHSDHMHMTKFEFEDDLGFINIAGELQRWVKKLGVMPATMNARSKAHFLVPFDRDPQFVGREDIITDINHKLEIKRRVALAGIGGVGKSQIAIEYCYRFKAENPSGNIFWVHASTVTRFAQTYNYIARKLNLPRYDSPEINTLQLVSEWLSDEDHGTWLMILDNADDIQTFFSNHAHASLQKDEQPTPLVRYLPRSSKGSVIITTRDARVGERLSDREKPIAVLPLAVQEAEHLLRSKLPQDHEWDGADTVECIDALGYLPLAITQAAAFISENRITLAEYVETLRASDFDLTSLLNEDLHDHRRDLDASNSIFRTWKISFDHIRKQKPQAVQLLSLIAVLDRHGVSKSLLHRDWQRTEFTTALAILQAFSLVVAEKGGEIFVMHRLVQLATQHWLEMQKTKELYQEEAMKLLSERFPNGEHENWNTCESLSPHADVVLQYYYTSRSSQLYRAMLLYNIAWYELRQGRYESAYRSCKEAYDERQRLLDGNDPETLNSLSLLASVLGSQGKYGEAEEMHRRVLQLMEKVLGNEHPSTLESMNNLASVLDSLGKYGEAEEMHRRVLQLKEKVLGNEHPDTLESMNNLASALDSLGKYGEAEEMHRRVLQLKEKVLGNGHPSTLESMNNLASVLDGQGKYGEAEEMHRRVLQLREKVLGNEHPSTLESMNNLASVLDSLGKYGEAEEMHRRVLQLKEKVLGNEHPSTLASMNNLAFVLDSQGKYGEAEEMHRRVLQLRDKVLGNEHPSTLASMNNLASALDGQGKYGEAEEMHRRVLQLKEKVLGNEHPSTLHSVYWLAFLFHKQRKYDDASTLYQRALAGLEKSLGPHHPTTVGCSKHHLSMLEEMKG